MARTEVTGSQIKDQSVSLTVDVTGILPVANGGTGSNTLALNNVLLGNGTGALQAVAPGTAANVLRSNGTSWASTALTKSDVGLANVDNTSDASKPVSTATQTALNGKEATITAGTTAQYWRGDKSWQTLNAAAVGLANVDNTSDATKNAATATLTNKTVELPGLTSLSVTDASLTNVALLAGLDYGRFPAFNAVSKYLWHDLLAFNRWWGTPTYETYNGTAWGSQTLDSSVFANKEATGITLANGTTATGVRWTWNSSSISASNNRWWIIGLTYVGATDPINTYLVESSPDGTIWTTRHTSTVTGQAAPLWLSTASPGSHTWIRLSIATTNAQPIIISNIKALSARWGNQGGGSELEYPYDWDASRNITTYGSLYSTRNTGTGLSTFSVGNTVLGNIHVQNGAGADNTSNYQAAITFQGGSATQAQAGIYVLNNSTDGTRMGFATTNNYATGPQLFMTASNAGVVNFPRALPQYNGVNLVDLSSTQTLTGKTLSGASNTFSNIPLTGLAAAAYATANTVSTLVQRDASGNFTAGTITAALTGNATTATTLQTARTINGVSFNGSANITVTDSTKEPTITAGTTAQYWRGDKSWQTLNVAAVSGAEATANKGVANGYASLDGGGKVPIGQLPSSLMEYQGVWNASTNTPTLANGTGSTGDVYRVSVAGTSLTLTFDVGDYVIYNGTTWEKSDTTDAVASVNGYTGNVTLAKADVGLGSVDNTADAAKNVLSATKWTTARTLAGNSVDGSGNVAFANKFIAQGTTDAGLSAAQFLGALGTGIVKNTTTTGVLSIALAADFPTLNQNTTGTAANVTGTVAVANGGTGATTLTGLIKGTGTTAMVAATAGTDYLVPGGVLGTPSSGTLTNCTGLPLAGLAAAAYASANTVSTLVQRDASGNFSAGTVTAALSGNASTATTLQTARAINGVSFNGSADITLPTVNTSGDQTVAGIKTFSSATKSSVAGSSWIGGHTGSAALSLTTAGTGVSFHGWASQRTTSGGFALGTLGDDLYVTWATAANIDAATNTVFNALRVYSNGDLAIGGSLVGGTVPWARLSNVPTTLTGTVNTSGDQTVAGIKTFSSTIVGSVNGNAATATTATYATAGMPLNTNTTFNARVIQNGNTTASNDGLYIGYGNANTGATRLYGGGDTANPVTIGTGGTVTATGAISGTTLTGSSTVQGTRLISTIATGTAPLTVASTTVVTNLNADLLDGYNTSTTASASTVAVRDTNNNLLADNFIPTATSTATAAGTTTLDVTASQVQVFTGTTTQTVLLPTTSILAGQSYTIVNNSTGAVAVQSSAANAITSLAAGTTGVFTAVINTPTTDAHWVGNALTAGKIFKATADLTLSGTDGNVYTFPASPTSDTVATTGATQTLTGKTLTNPTIDTINLGDEVTRGPILTLGAITGGSGYTDGTYTAVALTGGSGTLATADITVTGGIVTAVTLKVPGARYKAADVLSAAAATIGTLGTGFSIPVATVRTVTVSIYNATPPRIRLTNTNTAVAAGTEYGTLLFASNDATAGAIGDKVRLTATAEGTSGGGNLQVWTAANGAESTPAAAFMGDNTFRVYNPTGTFYHSLASGATAARALTLPDSAGAILTDASSATVSNKNFSAGTGNTWPTFNQSTTGSAATLTTSRNFQTNLASTTAAGFTGAADNTHGVTGTLPVGNGGTGATTLTGLIKGTGTTAMVAAVAGTDYLAPGGALGTPSSGTLTNCTFPTLNQNTTGTAANVTGTVAVGNGGTGATTLTGLVKGTGTTAMVAATAGTDYVAPGGALGTPSSGTLTSCTGLPLTGLASAAYATAATASVLAQRDANANLSADNFINTVETTATAALTTALAITSGGVQIFTGTTTQIVTLPTTSVAAGMSWMIINQSTGAVTVNASGGTTVAVLAASTVGEFIATIATPTTNAHWAGEVTGTGDVLTSLSDLTLAGADGKTLTVNHSLTLAGTDSTTMTFPATSATIARTDAAQTFTGVQTMTSPALTTPAITGAITGTYSFGGTPTWPTFNQNTTGTAANVTGTVAVGNGGTGATTLTGLVKGNGTAAMTAAVAGTDFVAPSGTINIGTTAVTINRASAALTLAGITLTSPTFSTIVNTGTLTLPTSTDTLVGRATTDTLTNKRITPRVGTTASTATPSIDTDAYDQYTITALAIAITGVTVTGTPTDGQRLMVRIKGDATPRAITWGASFVASGVAPLLTTTVASKTHLCSFLYDGTALKWVAVATDEVGY